MIDLDEFKKFIIQNFYKDQISIDEFKKKLWYIDLDIFPTEDYIVTILLSFEIIQIATYSRIPELDFSLYDYAFENAEDAKEFILNMKNKNRYPFPVKF
jgi:hypothetical protein